MSLHSLLLYANIDGRVEQVKLAAGIRKHGFRKWYERELTRSHAHMALTFICMIGVLAAFESASKNRGWADQAIDVVAVIVCGAGGLWALRRYLSLLLHAEHVAHQANCPACGTYARFQLVRADAEHDRVQVCCRQCGHEWTIQG
jgi:Zn ribbon nucleic-acid-binding protein